MARGRTGAHGRSRKAASRDAPPDVFRDMLGDLGASAGPAAGSDEGRAVKRRKVGGRAITVAASNHARSQSGSFETKSSDVNLAANTSAGSSPKSELQSIDFKPDLSSDQDADSDDEFEDVVIGEGVMSRQAASMSDADDGGALALNLVLQTAREAECATPRKRRLTSNISDKKLVVHAHKLHLLCLLSHISLRNHWCNDARVHKALWRLVPRMTREDMEDDPTEDQYTRDLKLRRGLRLAVESFKQKFQVTARGLRRAWWDAPEHESKKPDLNELDLITSRRDFRNAASNMSGSRDIGTQLFCALLRALALDVRLVCSLQPLPLNGATRPLAPDLPAPINIVRHRETRAGMDSDDNSDKAEAEAEADSEQHKSWKVSAIQRRLHGNLFQASSDKLKAGSASAASQRSPRTRNPIRESTQPVYWVEVFNPAYQKWIAVDPIATGTVGQPSKLEPALKDIRNSMSYVVGIEDDGSLRDVTRRYASHFNAKTRKLRLDGLHRSEDGQWWKRVLRLYGRPTKLTKDDIEDAEMQRREEREGMPRNIEDFKGHPLYVLERHVRRNEVIHPKRQVGLTGVGQSGDEAVFRRRDVHVVRSATAWYRAGREIKMGEQPLKTSTAKPRARARSEEIAEDDEDEGARGLYAIFQTVVYRAPPAKNGRVPRNAYGNLDVYVPSMIPPGAVHFLHPNTKDAARLLGIDFVEAVTGFEFRGRQGNAVVRGAVIASEYKDAVLETLHCMADAKADAEANLMRRQALQLWRRFLVGLRIHERVAGYAAESGDRQDYEGSDEEFKIRDAMDGDEDEAEEVIADKDGGGGFLDDTTVKSLVAGTQGASESIAASTLTRRSSDWTVLQGPEIKKAASARDAQKSLRKTGPETALGQIQTTDPPPDSENDSLPEGGGFIAEEGGGFVVDEDGDPSLDRTGPAGRTGNANAFKSGVSNVAAPKDTTNIVVSGSLERLPESLPTEAHARKEDLLLNRRSDGGSEPEPGNQRKLVDSAGEAKSGALGGGASQTEDTAKIQGNIATSEADREDDRGSLLSEDPEDEDADPDWLV